MAVMKSAVIIHRVCLQSVVFLLYELFNINIIGFLQEANCNNGF